MPSNEASVAVTGVSALVARPPEGCACCGTSARVTLPDCVERGLRRNRRDPLAVVGSERTNDEGDLRAQFSLLVEAGVIQDVSFKVTSCAALVAYSELIAECVTGVAVAEAAGRIRPSALVEALPGVPAPRRNRALLATSAWLAALATATQGGAV